MAVSHVSGRLLVLLLLTALGLAQVPRDPDDQISYYMLNPQTSKDPGRVLEGDKPESIVFYFYRNSNSAGVRLAADGSNALQAGWSPSKTAKVIVHGFGNSVQSPFSTNIKNAYLNYGDFNVVVVDWSPLCQTPNYFRAARNVKMAGDYLGRFLQNLIRRGATDYRFLHLVGHSLGSHVAGIAAQAGGPKFPIHRVTALDPAGPLFDYIFQRPGLVKNSALIIDTMITDSGRLGHSTSLGNINFRPNGGRGQPGCGLDVFGTCGHSRAYQYFEETIYTHTNFPATRCSSYANFRAGRCGRPTAGMGDAVSFEFDGDYFCDTNAFTPFNRG